MSLRSLLGFVLVGFPTTKVHFIALNSTPQAHHIMLCIKGANLMKDEPSSFLCNRNVGSQLNRRDTLLVGGDKVHSHKPLLKRKFGVLKDSSHKAREPLVTLSTFELIIPVGASVNVLTTTERTRYLTMPTLLCDEVTATLVRVEVVSEGDEGVEVL